jgi:hypothetical protein
MAFKDCIVNGLKDGDLTPEQAKAAQDVFEQREAMHKNTMGDSAASAKAAQETIEILDFDRLHKKRVLLLQKEKQQDISKKLFGQEGYRGGRDPGMGAKALIAKGDPFSTYSNVEARQASIFGQFQSQISDILATFRARGPLGLHSNVNTLHDVVRELWGTNTGNSSAREMAEAWSKVGEMARQMYNEAGGAIPKLDTWRLPQSHNMMAVMKAGQETWVKFVTPLLDNTKMINERTGKSFTPQELDLALNEVFRTIGEDGFNKLKPTGALYTGHRSLAKRYMDHRFLQFKTADDWMKYQESFGNPDTFASMNQYLHRMSHDIAMMQVLGPNPHATMNFIRQSVMKDAQELKVKLQDQNIAAKAEKNLDEMDELFQLYNGSAYASADSATFKILGFNVNVPRTLQGTRNIINSAFLGSTAITSLSDLGFQKHTATQLGIAFGPLFKRVFKNLNPLNVEERGKIALRAGLIADSWIGLAQTQARFAGEMTGPQITQRFSDVVMRASGLTAWTQAGRHAFGMELMGNLSDLVGKSFDNLDPKMQKALTRYGFDNTSWDLIRQSELYNHQGATFLRPEEIRLATHMPKDQAQELALRFLDMVNTEIDYAVPTVGLRAKATLTGGTKPGTVPGEIVRSFSMFKNFSVQVLYTHLWKVMSEATLAKKAGSFADLVIATTAMAALSMQLKEMANGRDPRAIDTPEFWGAAFLQGGGMGIWGDFLFSNVNRYGGGLEDTIAGPVINMANSVKNLTYGNVKQLIQGEETNFAGESIRMLETYLPGKTLWYGKLLFQHGLFERLHLYADPKYQQRLNRMQTKYLKETGQHYWWRPGEQKPDRLPEISSETLLTQ